MIHAALQYHYLALAAVIYILLIAGCIEILVKDPVAEGSRLKDRMILALTIPNFIMLLARMSVSL